MNKVYNKINDVVNGFYDFFKNFSNSKTLLNFMPQFLCSIIDAESVTYSKIALSLFSNFNGNIKLDSHFKRIYRFLHNPHYNIHSIFDNVIYDVLSRFKLAHDDNNFHISFDHMFDKTNFTVFMLTLRTSKQGIPIYFEVFNGSNNGYHGDAFKMVNIKKLKISSLMPILFS